MMLCIDPGHGMSNRTSGVFDPGAVAGSSQEANEVLLYALELERQWTKLGGACFLTRRDNTTSAPLRGRVIRATTAGATHLLSIHMNSVVSDQAHGTETLYFSNSSMATKVQKAMIKALGLRDRGIKPANLPILRFSGPCALAEIGFISNASDRAAMLDPMSRSKWAKEICEALLVK